MPLPLYHRLTHEPQALSLCLALREGSVRDDLRLECRLEERIQALPQRRIRRAASRFQQHVPGAGFSQRIDGAGHMAQGEVDTDPWDQLETGNLVAGRRTTADQQIKSGGRRRHRQECRFRCPWSGKQLQHRRGDDAQRAFGADEQLLQVVAGIVLA